MLPERRLDGPGDPPAAGPGDGPGVVVGERLSIQPPRPQSLPIHERPQGGLSIPLVVSTALEMVRIEARMAK